MYNDPRLMYRQILSLIKMTPIKIYKHKHVYIHLSLLTKLHRDSDFSHLLLKSIEKEVSIFIPKDFYLSLDLEYMGEFYLTNKTLLVMYSLKFFYLLSL